MKLQASACNFIKKETLAQVLCYEFCEMSKNNFLRRAPLVAASVNYVYSKLSTTKLFLHGFFALNKQGKWKANVIMLLKSILSFFLIFLANLKTDFESSSEVRTNKILR